MNDGGSMPVKRKNNEPKQRRDGRGATSTTVVIKTSLPTSATELEEIPLIDPHRRTSSNATRATEEHSSWTSEDDNDDYQQFLELLNSSSDPSLPPQNSDEAITSTDMEGREGSGGFVADMVELHEQLIQANEVRGCRQGVSTKKESTSTSESHDVVDAVNEFESWLDEGVFIPDFAEWEETDTLQCTDEETSGKDVDSAMAWCALAAVLGGRAPSCVAKNAGGKMKEKEQLWEMDTDFSIGEDIPDFPFDDESVLPVVSPTSEGAPDLNDTSFDTSFDESEEDEDSLFIVPDVEGAQEFMCEELYQKTSVKDAADSTLAWSALALLLGAPPPASVTRKTRNVSRVSDDASNDEIPTLQ